MKLISTLLAVAVLIVVGGCTGPGPDSSIDPFTQKLTMLERGQAVGDIEINSDGRAGVGTSNSVWIGAQQTSVKFKGSVDFRSKLERDDVGLPATASAAETATAESNAEDGGATDASGA